MCKHYVKSFTIFKYAIYTVLVLKVQWPTCSSCLRLGLVLKVLQPRKTANPSQLGWLDPLSIVCSDSYVQKFGISQIMSQWAEWDQRIDQVLTYPILKIIKWNTPLNHNQVTWYFEKCMVNVRSPNTLPVPCNKLCISHI